MRGDTDRQPVSAPECRRWIVFGKVQGVGFRYYVLQSARSTGVVGDVRNLEDGRVEIRAQGSVEQLDRLLDAVNRGPTWARVDGVDSLEATPRQQFDRFRIR